MPAPRPRLLLAALLAVGLALAACGSDAESSTPSDGETEVGGATSTVRPSTTSAPASSAPAETTAPAISAPTAYTAQAADAANELKAAWEAGDRPRALAIAPSDVVEALFLVPAEGFEIYGCDTGEFDTSTCNYRNRSTGVYIPVTMVRSEQGWQVGSIYVGD